MRRFQASLSLLCVTVLSAASVSAQDAIRVEAPNGGLGWLTRPYQQRIVPPINLTNSGRLEALVRAGNLYLSAQDVIALALENNLDIEVQRYGPLLAREVTRRAKGGGPLRSVGVGVAAGPQSVSLTGVSLTASGGVTTAAGAGVSSGGGIVTQLGPTIPLLDPQLNFFTQFAHTTSPQSNTQLTGTTALVLSTRTYQAQYQQVWDFGLNASFTYSSQRTRVNSPFFDLNPFTSGFLDLTVTQPLLQGLGRAVNGRNIRVAKNNQKVSGLQFKQQVITTVSAVLNLYWDLVSFNQDLRARKDELATAQQLLEDNRKQVQIGTLAPIEVTRAEAQVYSSQQDLLVSQTNLLQQETVLKNALSRNGVASPTLADVHIVPLDTIVMPPGDTLPTLNQLGQLVQQALDRRVEIAQSRINIESNKMNLVGIKNSLRPTLNAFAELTDNGLTGSQNALAAPFVSSDPLLFADPFLVGGYGNLLGQIFHRNYPNYSAGFSLNIPLRNRAAQSDYASSQLELRQNELVLQKNVNQVRVDVQNALIGLQQARARYDSAVKARILQQQTLDADRKKYTLGASTVFQVVQDQQTVAAAESSETQALANYSHARIAFDQAMGTTLDVNHISLDEALSGHVSRQSVLPANLPNPERPTGQAPGGVNQ
ncbi:MAG: TolC family protein [Acidobacteriaceae bacterium]|nr:TolC family protein [Acidobacteriaceae bacterium]MBV9780692.1 TolC family protein [Acidobacteriaceae bacterium]